MNTSRNAYAAARNARLEALLEDPESWTWIATHALTVRDQHAAGTPGYSLLTRLHHVARDLTEYVNATDPDVAP